MTAGLILGMALAGAVPAGTPQAQPPVFRAEAYVVVFKVSAFTRSWYGRSRPEVGLTTADFTITLDKKDYVPVKLEPDPEKPGHYLLSFSPPDEVRDGKARQIEVKFKKRDFLKWTITFPEPTRTERPTPFDRAATRAGFVVGDQAHGRAKDIIPPDLRFRRLIV